MLLLVNTKVRGMPGLVKEEIFINEEVTHFVCTENGYTAITLSGRILNIIRSRSLQPPIEDKKDFFTYLWVEAMEGFFLFRQRILDFKAEQWILEKQLIPYEEKHFFFAFLDEFKV